MSANVGHLLHRWAERDRGRIGIIDAGRDQTALTYQDLDGNAGRVAAALVASGALAGDRVAVLTDNGMGFVAAWFGAVYAGCATLPMPVSSTAHEIAFRLDHAQCSFVIADAPHAAVVMDALSRTKRSIVVIRVEEAIESGARPVAPHDVSPESYAMLLYTSGTTGAAKCACITHGSLGAHTRALAEDTLRLTEGDRVLGTLPLAHSYGIRTTLLVPFHAGASTVFVPRFSPRRTLELCASHEVTWLPGVPTMFIAWADEDDSKPPAALRWCMSAGAPLAETVRRRAEHRLGAPVRQAYGLTEANLTAVNAPPDIAVPGSSGKPVSGVEIRIERDDGRAAPEGEPGEVLVRGANVMAGYLDDTLATRHVLRGGWLHTGDLGVLDAEGRLGIVGRTKDLILRGGASIYPSEVESTIAMHPSVREVAVVGQPHDYYGEEVVAVVVVRGEVSPSELDAWVRNRIARYKAPARYAFTEALPRNASGKVLKRHLRDRLAARELPSSPARPGD